MNMDALLLNPTFLRGGPYAHSYSICYRCHNQEYYALFDPHDQLDSKGNRNTETCLYCHREPESGHSPDLKVGEYRKGVCYGCHRVKTHLTGSDHMKKPDTKMRAAIRSIEKERKLYLPLNEKNEITCATCHNPHTKGVFPDHDVRSLGSEGKVPVRKRVRVEEGVICNVCHQKSNSGGS